MKVYILFSSYVCQEHDVFRKIIGIYNCLFDAQLNMIDAVRRDFEWKRYDHMCVNSKLNPAKVTNFFINPTSKPKDSEIDITEVFLWDDFNKNSSDNNQHYTIEEHEVFESTKS